MPNPKLLIFSFHVLFFKTFKTLYFLIFGLGIFPVAELLIPQPIIAQTQRQRLSPQNAYNEATEQFRQGNYTQALQLYQQALIGYQNSGNHPQEATTHHKLGATYYHLDRYDEAIVAYQNALEIREQLGDRAGVGSTLNGIGVVYHARGDYDEAIVAYQNALAIRQELEDALGEGRTLNNLGLLWENRGEYATALELYDRALEIFQNLENRAGEGAILNNIGSVYNHLGQYEKALEFYQDALNLAWRLEDRPEQAKLLHNMGLVATNVENDDRAVGFYQQALDIRRALEDRPGTAATLNNLALVYLKRDRLPDAIPALEEALDIFQTLGDRAGVGRVLDSLGTLYRTAGNSNQALTAYQRSLLVQRQIGDRPGEILTLNHLGAVLEQQGRIELAIVFYKQSVNFSEEIRQDLQQLPAEFQESYTATIADTYRHLADLLLQQDRVLEAQQVLDLLKLQEIDDYLKQVRGNEETGRGVDNLPQEDAIWEEYSELLDAAISEGRELETLREIPPADRTEAQNARIAELVETQQNFVAEFNQFAESEEVEATLDTLSRTVRRQSPDLEELNALQDNLRQLEQNAVLFYPLVLDSRLELVVVTPFAPPIHKPVRVSRQELNRAIVEFREALQNPTVDATRPARQLYDWLIEPIEEVLAEANTDTIIYAPDAQLRYIPLAALYDGDRWLVERFRINHITAASLTDLNSQPRGELKILAGAFANGSYSVQVGMEEFNFGGLPYAGVEVETLAQTIPNTTQLIDTEFSPEATIPRMDDYTITHFATHAAFVSGQPEDSFILFGNGDRVTLQDVKTWVFRNVDLVVLSACETGVGGWGNGEEILGFGYLMQRAGARASIATLWSVDDGGTQILMNAFYRALQDGMTKAESLRQAQISLIAEAGTATDERGAAIEVTFLDANLLETLPADARNRLSHPYYWSPFILIGNGLRSSNGDV